MYLLDTNIFFELLLDQPAAQACQETLESLDEDHPGWVTSFTVHAIEAILTHRKRTKALQRFLESLAENPFLTPYTTTLEEEIEICRLTQKVALDFDDALQYSVAKKKRLTLVTLDQDFRKVRDIQVVSPWEVVSHPSGTP